MVYCFQAGLKFSSVARRDTVLASLQTRIAGKARFSVDVLGATVQEGQPAIMIELRFTARADLDDLGAHLEGFATGVRTPLAGSWYRLHDCPHDVGNIPCGSGTLRTYA